MKTTQPITRLLYRLWQHTSPRRARQFTLMLPLMILASCAEILSIGAVLPFLGALTAPERIFEHPIAQPFIKVTGIAASNQLLFPLTAIFCITTLVAAAMRLFLLHTSLKLSFAAGADLSNDIYRRTLYQPYATHIARNSSELIAAVSTKAHTVIYGVMVPILTLASTSIILAIILITLLIINPLLTLTTLGGLGLVYGTIIATTRNQQLINSKHIAHASTKVIKSLQEALGGIRDVLIDNNQEVFCKIYKDTDQVLRQAQANNQFLSQSPRYGIEALGMLTIATIAYFLAREPNGIMSAIPTLGALALAAQRLFPLMQQAYIAGSTILGGQASLQDTLDLLDQPLPKNRVEGSLKPIVFQSKIHLNNVSFHYNKNTNNVLHCINLTIEKGSRIGIIGPTGSGKSTLLDIIMGLLQPTGGSLEIDDQSITSENCRAWQAHIAHVPQTIFLADCSILENIAFGIPKNLIDYERAKRSAHYAQIADTVESWPNQYQTVVGERGVRLSGGQRQRIGIARALYKQADVIIFDEATNALDSETEQSVIEAIENLSDNITTITVAHRHATLKKCTTIIEINDGYLNVIDISSLT